MEETNKAELIEQYVLGKLTGTNLQAFERKLSEDDSLKREVAMERATIKNLKLAGRKEWSLKLEDFHQEMNMDENNEQKVLPLHQPSKSLKSVPNWKIITSIAATVSVLILVTVLVNRYYKENSLEDIYISYYQPYQSIEQTTRSTNSDQISERERAFEFYDNGNYAASIKVFEDILAKEKDESVLFYLGNAYLSIGNPNEAESIFKNYLAKYSEFETEAKWYLSLCYLKQNKENEAKVILVELSKQSNKYRENANSILKSLK